MCLLSNCNFREEIREKREKWLAGTPAPVPLRSNRRDEHCSSEKKQPCIVGADTIRPKETCFVGGNATIILHSTF